jgi:hypothetical protein
MTVHWGALRNKIGVENSGSSKKKQRCLDALFLQPELLVPGRTRSTPFHALLFRHRIEFKIPTFTTSHNSSQHVTNLVNKFDATASNIQPHSSLSAAKECGTNLDKIFLNNTMS